MKFWRPSLLDRYLLRQTLWLLGMTLIIGTGVYVLTELFDRMDNFFEAKVGVGLVLLYFLAKIPLIISQILPAAFLLSCIIQLCLMARSRELLALQAAGISLWRVTAFFVCFALACSVVQLFLAENLGVEGNRYAMQLWREHVSGKVERAHTVKNLWFVEDSMIIYAGSVNIQDKKGQDFTCYDLSEDGLQVERVIRAPSFNIDNKTWKLHRANVYDTNGFVRETDAEISIKINYSPNGLRVLASDIKQAEYSLWQIGDTIKRLKKAGSNVESLRTTWHMKLAYAVSLLVMALLASSLVTWQDNIYITVALGMMVTFVFYTVLSVAGTLGEKGRITPMMAAWFPIIFFMALSLLRLLRVAPPRFLIQKLWLRFKG